MQPKYIFFISLLLIFLVTAYVLFNNLPDSYTARLMAKNQELHYKYYYKNMLDADTINFTARNNLFVWTHKNVSYIVNTHLATVSNHDQILNSLKANVVEGYAIPAQANFMTAFLQANSQIHNILETGFNAGHSASIFLGARPDTQVTSFDIGHHDYVELGRKAIDLMYPGRLDLIIGNSVDTIPEFIKTHSMRKFDLGFVDGGHMGEVPYLDILNMSQLIQPGGWIIVDDMVDMYPSIVKAWYMLAANDVITPIAILKFDDRAWGIARIN